MFYYIFNLCNIEFEVDIFKNFIFRFLQRFQYDNEGLEKKSRNIFIIHLSDLTQAGTVICWL